MASPKRLFTDKNTDKAAESVSTTFHYAASYSASEDIDGTFVNDAMNSRVLKAVKEAYGLSKLDNVRLTKKDVKNIIDAQLHLD